MHPTKSLKAQLFSRNRNRNIRKLEIKVVGGYFVGEKNSPNTYLPTPPPGIISPSTPASSEGSPITPSTEEPRFSIARIFGQLPSPKPGDLKQISVDPSNFLPKGSDVVPGALFVDGTLDGVVDVSARKGKVRFAPSLRSDRSSEYFATVPDDSIRTTNRHHSPPQEVRTTNQRPAKDGLLTVAVGVSSWMKKCIFVIRDRRREEQRKAFIADESFEAGSLSTDDLVELAQQEWRAREWERELQTLTSLPTTESWLAGRNEVTPPPSPEPLPPPRSRSQLFGTAVRLSSFIGLADKEKKFDTPQRRRLSKAIPPSSKPSSPNPASRPGFATPTRTSTFKSAPEKPPKPTSPVRPAASKRVSHALSPAALRASQSAMSSVSSSSTASSRSYASSTRSSATRTATKTTIRPVSIPSVAPPTKAKQPSRPISAIVAPATTATLKKPPPKLRPNGPRAQPRSPSMALTSPSPSPAPRKLKRSISTCVDGSSTGSGSRSAKDNSGSVDSLASRRRSLPAVAARRANPPMRF